MDSKLIEAVKADPESYGLDDGEEHIVVLRAMTTAIEMDRHDLVTELIATGCTGPFTAGYTLAA